MDEILKLWEKNALERLERARLHVRQAREVAAQAAEAHARAQASLAEELRREAFAEGEYEGLRSAKIEAARQRPRAERAS